MREHHLLRSFCRCQNQTPPYEGYTVPTNVGANLKSQRSITGFYEAGNDLLAKVWRWRDSNPRPNGFFNRVRTIVSCGVEGTRTLDFRRDRAAFFPSELQHLIKNPTQKHQRLREGKGARKNGKS